MLNLNELEKDAFEVLGEQDKDKALLFVEKWSLILQTEITTLRNRVNLLEARNLELETEMDYINGTSQ